MDRIYDNCCGIDVRKKLIVACFRKGNKQEICEFGATTRELLELTDWLKNGGCEMVAMESTASYWKPLYNILESSNLNAMVVNARHMKAVPGRKTDVKDAEWIIDLLQHGLLQLCPCCSEKQKVILLCPVYENQCTLWIKTSLCCSCPFYAHSHISHSQRRCSFQGSWS